jgi:hypothetical protein
MTRVYTNKLLEMLEEGLLDKDMVIMACMKWMTEDDVKGMMEANEMVEEEDEEYDPMDDFNYVGSRHHY